MSGQNSEDTRKFSPEELRKFGKGLTKQTSNEIEFEEIGSIDDLPDQHEPQKKSPDETETQKLPKPVEQTQLLPPSYYNKKPVDLPEHKETKTRDGKRSVTTIWELGDLRKSKAKIFKGYEGLPWAIANLVKETNQAIAKEEIHGDYLKEGDIVQACVVSYYDGAVQKPRTTPDSPKYSTLPYIIIREEGYLTTKPSIPKGSEIHFNIPEKVGDLIPVEEKLKESILVTLQLKEAAHTTGDLEEVIKQPQLTYKSDLAHEEAKKFIDFLNLGKQKTPTLSERVSSNDQKDFGF